MAGKRRVGRPRKSPSEPKLASLGLRVPQELKDRLDREAEHSGRSQSQEAAFRLNKTFQMQDGAGDELELMNIINLVQAVRGKSWREDPETRRKLMAITIAFFMRNAPDDFDPPNAMELYGQKETLDLLYRALEVVFDDEEPKK